MTIKMFFATLGTLALLSTGVAYAQTRGDGQAGGGQEGPGAAHGEIAGVLEAGRRQKPARQAAQEVHEQLQEGLSRRASQGFSVHSIWALIAFFCSSIQPCGLAFSIIAPRLPCHAASPATSGRCRSACS